MDKKIEEMTDRELLVHEAGVMSELQRLQKELQAIQQEFSKRIREELQKQQQ